MDNPLDKIQENLQETPSAATSAVVLTVALLGTIFPLIGAYNAAQQHFAGRALEKRLNELAIQILDALRAQGIAIEELAQKHANVVARIESPEFIQTLILAVERTARIANEQKIKRFALVLVNGLTTGAGGEQDWDDASTFIRTLEELSDLDLKVLRHLYKHQKRYVQEHHAIDTNSFYLEGRMSALLLDVSTIQIQMDDFYARCARLSGYGLVLPLERGTQNIGPSDFGFRMTLLGMRLLEILDPELINSSDAQPLPPRNLRSRF